MQNLQIDNVVIPIITLQEISLHTIGVSQNAKGSSASKDWYLQRGLVFHLDGIDKGPNEGAWTDLQFGFKFSPIDETEFGENYVLGVLECPEMIDVGAFDGTVEIVFEPTETTTNNQGYFQVGKDKSIAFGFAGRNAIIGMGQNAKITFPIGLCNDLKPYAISANADECLVSLADGETPKADDYWIIRNPNVMRVQSGTNKAKIYSIRVYNRKLDQWDMRHNQNVDKKRFGFSFREQIWVPKNDNEIYSGDEFD